ncbi:DDE-domain-containing protein, partial [Fistulina hepatica ATCC 64428]
MGSDQGFQRVVGRRGQNTQHRQGSANRENTTVLVTICADGSTVTPVAVFKAKNFQSSWNDDNPAGIAFTHSESGWSNGEIAVSWFGMFERETRAKADDGRALRVIFMDGHSSHYTPELLEEAKRCNVKIIGYPPHCTHALQGLDVVCFGRMKVCWKQELHEFELTHERGVNKNEFAAVWGRAFIQAFTVDNVKMAFAATGIWPYNPEAIHTEQTKPSDATSLEHALPIDPSSPVKAVLRAFHTYQPTAAQLDLGTYEPATKTKRPSAIHDDSIAQHRSILPVNPICSESSVDTAPEKMRLLTSELAQTKSGAFLMAKSEPVMAQHLLQLSPPSADHPHPDPDVLPTPDWSLLETHPSTYE